MVRPGRCSTCHGCCVRPGAEDAGQLEHGVGRVVDVREDVAAPGQVERRVGHGDAGGAAALEGDAGGDVGDLVTACLARQVEVALHGVDVGCGTGRAEPGSRRGGC